MKTEKITYQSGENSFEGFLAQPEGDSNPCVLIAHTWAGRDAFVEEKAKLLTELGYAAFAIDMYGDGKIGTSNEENAGMMQPLLDDREELARRALASLDAVSKIDSIDASKIVIMG